MVLYLFEESVSVPALQQALDVLAEGQANVLVWILDQINQRHEERLGVGVTAAHVHVLTHVSDVLYKHYTTQGDVLLLKVIGLKLNRRDHGQVKLLTSLHLWLLTGSEQGEERHEDGRSGGGQTDGVRVRQGDSRTEEL